MPGKLDKLLIIRSRLKDAMNHHAGIIRAFTDQTTQNKLILRDRALDKTWAEFAINIDSLDGMQFATVQEANADNQLYEDMYIDLKTIIADLIAEENQEELDMTMAPHTSHYSNKSVNNIKLPAIDIKAFNGNLGDWAEFKDLFNSLITENDDMPDIQKLHYLKKFLVGKPLQLIKHLAMTRENYTAAWQILSDRYENSRAIVNSYLKTLIEIPNINVTTSESIRIMLDTINSILSALGLCNIDTSTWDPLVIYLMIQKFDRETLRYWEEELSGSKECPELKQFINFLEVRYNILDNMPRMESHKTESNKPKAHGKVFTNQEKKYSCFICLQSHKTYQCPVINNAALTDRYRIVEEKDLCKNCLFKHNTNDCQSKFRCKTCNEKHHSLLHRQINSENNAHGSGNASSSQNFHLMTNSNVILATAIVPVQSTNGTKIYLRALLDQGSTINIVTEAAALLIQARKIRVNHSIIGIGDTQTGIIKHKIQMDLGSMYDSDYSYKIEAAIVPKLTRIGDIFRKEDSTLKYFEKMDLADPNYHVAGRIDLLLGATAMAEILLEGLIKGQIDAPIAQQTKLGWILSGSYVPNIEKRIKCNFAKTEDEQISVQLRKFWELEEVYHIKSLSQEEEECEKQFRDGLSRTSDGKYMVKLPFKIDPETPNFLGKFYEIAKKRFLALERKLMRNKEVYDVYSECINEYLHMGQMRLATKEEEDEEDGYFLPHHAVIKDSTTTQVRVVYDASCKTTNGFSLNDRLLVGPVLQAKLFAHLVRWRVGKIAMSADLAKMYRMIWVDPKHVKYQKILWRNKNDEALRIYIILCLLFGTASAAYQAIRVLLQIAKDIKDIEPYLAYLIMTRFYVDDFLCNAKNVEEAKWIQKRLTEIFSKYGFQLRKWVSNSPELLQSIPIDEQEKTVTLNADASSKTLGIIWKPVNDTLNFKLKLPEDTSIISKRKILSEVSQLFDPLGFLAPTIIKAKIFLQSLWATSLSWDDSLSPNLIDEWLKIRKDLFNCELIIIDRWIGVTENYKNCSLHVFTDASMKAYAAVVYCRVETSDGIIIVNMVAAKTKVAPLDGTTLPRLELCGALLGAELGKCVAKNIEIENIPIEGHTDSEIVLAWLKADPKRWKPFVSNRVASIQKLMNFQKWHYVSSKHNPADCASRGITFVELNKHELWWHGPKFLATEQASDVPGLSTDPDTAPEKRGKINICLSTDIISENELLLRFSVMKNLVSFTAYCFRWIHKVISKRIYKSRTPCVDELEIATAFWIRHVQNSYFKKEIELIAKNKALAISNPMFSLCPFVDESGFIRVGGRLQNADITMNHKHPYLMPRHGHFAKLIIRNAHLKTLHSGCQGTLNYIRQKYWIIRAKNVVKTEVNKCVTCIRFKQQTLKQQMGQLPLVRVQQSRPFEHVGIDFAGYFETRTSSRRNATYNKCYAALFICMVTRAIHLELVTNLSTQMFLMAFKRFISRRGLPSQVYTDQGTNFIGAKNEMPNLLKDVNTQQTKEIVHNLAQHGVKWNLNPARAPHFGGLWESGVRSTKYHLKRILKDTRIQYEEFETLLCQIESCLNSRPICPLSNDIEDLTVLTPGHFLIGQPLNQLPEPSILEIPCNRLKQYQIIQKRLQSFWAIWSKEYLHRLQQRPKWVQPQENIRIGHLVLIKEDNLPPAQWLLGRVINIFPGKDGLVRVAEIRSKASILKRSIHKLCLLPVTEELVTNIK